MKTRRNSYGVLLALIAMVAVAAGCDAGFVREAGRENLASFVTDVLTTAINEVINPND